MNSALCEQTTRTARKMPAHRNCFPTSAHVMIRHTCRLSFLVGRASILALSVASAAAVAAVAASVSVATPLHSQAAPSRGTDVKPVWPDEGPMTWKPRPTSSEISANDLRTRLYGFADDSMMGRRIGEIGNYKGTEYIASEFKRLGLKPAGDNGTYFQNLAFGPASFSASTSSLMAGSTAIATGSAWIPMAPSAANGYGATANLSSVPTVFAGRLGDTSVALDPALLRGKVAVFLAAADNAGGGGRGGAAALPTCDAVPDKFGAAAAAAVEATPAGRRTRAGAGGVRDTRAQSAGAVGVLIIGLESVSPAQRSAAFASRMMMQPGATPPSALPAATISDEAASKIFGKPASALTVGATGQPVTARWNYEWKMSATPGRNVIAILPGSDPARASEYVLVGAHNDHVGVNNSPVDHDSLRAVNMITRRQGGNDPACIPTASQQRQIDSLIRRARSIRAPRLDSIMNGADDDGSGTVVLLEIAEKFAAEKPARSIIFISHQGEEAGLLGSRWFVDHPTVPLSSIVAAHNMDMVGKGYVWQVKFGGPSSVQTLGARRISREFGDIIDSVNATRGETMAIDKSWDVTANPMNRFCRSDQVNYVNKDIPVTYFSLGYALDYHQPTDEPQYIDYDHAARVGRFVHDVMLAVADRQTRPAIAGQDPSYPSCR